MVTNWSPKLDFIIILGYLYILDLDIISYSYQDIWENEEHLSGVVSCMFVGFNFFIFSICSFQDILNCSFVDQIPRLQSSLENI